jgi:hypothetical protein
VREHGASLVISDVERDDLTHPKRVRLGQNATLPADRGGDFASSHWHKACFERCVMRFNHSESSKKSVVILESASSAISGLSTSTTEVCALVRLGNESFEDFSRRAATRLSRLGSSGIRGVELVFSEAEASDAERVRLTCTLLAKLRDLGIFKLKLRFPLSLGSSLVPFTLMESIRSYMPSGMEVFLRFDHLWDFGEEPGTGISPVLI